jgi:hypothetical protein
MRGKCLESNAVLCNIQPMKTNPLNQVGCPMSRCRAMASRLNAAFTRVDLVAVLATTALLTGLVFPLMASSRPRAEQVTCANNLRQIGQAIRTWGVDHGNKPPWMVEQKDGGYAPGGGKKVTMSAWQVFAFMSDLPTSGGIRLGGELSTPKVLVCPSDTKNRANDWISFIWEPYRNQSVSYFIGLHAPPEESASLLSGDRNLGYMDVIKAADCKVGANNADSWLPSGGPLLWTNSIHGVQGNILQNSGAVQQFDNTGLAKALDTNSLMLNFESTPALHLLLP